MLRDWIFGRGKRPYGSPVVKGSIWVILGHGEIQGIYLSSYDAREAMVRMVKEDEDLAPYCSIREIPLGDKW